MITALIKIARPLLSSRAVRRTVTGGTGLRVISSGTSTPASSGGIGGFLKSILGGLVNFTGWLISGVFGGLAFSFSAAWSWVSQAAIQLYHFNWNVTDQSIDQLLEAQKAIVAGQLGETIGNLLGYLVCGIAPSAAIFAFNEPLGAYLLAKVGEEAFEEFVGNFQQLLKQSFNMLVQRFAYGAFKSIRRAARILVNDPNSKAGNALRLILGDKGTKAVQGWGTTNKPWSFAQAVDNAIDSLNNPVLENFFEELVDSFIEGCIEAGYVVAGGLDSWVAQQRLAQTNSPFGAETTLEVIPNRQTVGESIVLSAPRELLRQELVSTMRSYQLIGNRDIGMFFGEEISDRVRKDSNPNFSYLTLKIQFYGVPKPPWVKNGKLAKRAQTSVPNVERSKLDWEKIKVACGGSNGYLWGRFLGIAKLANISGTICDEMRIYAGSASEAEERLIALADLTDYKIAAINITEERKYGRRETSKSLYKETTKVFPAYFTVVNSQKVLNEEEGINSLNGTYKKQNAKILLWVDEKPNDYDLTITELFKSKDTTE